MILDGPQRDIPLEEERQLMLAIAAVTQVIPDPGRYFLVAGLRQLPSPWSNPPRQRKRSPRNLPEDLAAEGAPRRSTKLKHYIYVSAATRYFPITKEIAGKLEEPEISWTTG